MTLWQITPVADPDDSRWLDYTPWREVVVRAETAGEAIALAAERLDPVPRERLGNESAADRSGLEDEKLYRLKRIEPASAGLEEAEAEGPPDLLRASRVAPA